MSKPLRQRIRDVTDALPRGEWLRARDIYQRLARPRPPAVSYITTELKTMCDLGFMERRGVRQLYEYRSGPRPVIDGRQLLKGPRRETRHLGFAALARLEQDDPVAWARETANDAGFRREEVL